MVSFFNAKSVSMSSNACDRFYEQEKVSTGPVFERSWFTAQKILLEAQSNLSLGSTKTGIHSCRLCGLKFPRDQLLQKHHARHMQALAALESVSKWRCSQMEASLSNTTKMPGIGEISSEYCGSTSVKRNLLSESTPVLRKRVKSEDIVYRRTLSTTDDSFTMDSKSQSSSSLLKALHEIQARHSNAGNHPAIQKKGKIGNASHQHFQLLKSALRQVKPETQQQDCKSMTTCKLQDAATFGDMWRQVREVSPSFSRSSTLTERGDESPNWRKEFSTSAYLAPNGKTELDSGLDLELRL